jgi:hypothetical protein
MTLALDGKPATGIFLNAGKPDERLTMVRRRQ